MISLKTGDTRPLDVVLKRGSTPIDVTAATVTFRMSSQSGSFAVEGECEVVPDTTGAVRYEWETGQTDHAGLYYAEWEVDVGGVKETVPASSYETIRIAPELVVQA